MKIKTVKKMRLDELIKHIYENDEKNRIFIDDGEQFAVHSNSSCAAVNIEHLKEYDGKKCISKNDTFTVEDEEELTIFTHLEDVVEVLFDDTVIDYRYTSISDIQGNQTSEIYVAQNGKLHLIWSAESGIPESGVLEVGAE